MAQQQGQEAAGSTMASMADLSPREVRERIRTGEWTRPTSGLCLGYQQAKYPHFYFILFLFFSFLLFI
jgi:uncharacterized protein YcsI (UPF0317 family)